MGVWLTWGMFLILSVFPLVNFNQGGEATLTHRVSFYADQAMFSVFESHPRDDMDCHEIDNERFVCQALVDDFFRVTPDFVRILDTMSFDVLAANQGAFNVNAVFAVVFLFGIIVMLIDWFALNPDSCTACCASRADRADRAGRACPSCHCECSRRPRVQV